MSDSAAINATGKIGEVSQSPRQNWVLSPIQDGLFIIAAPLIVLAAAVLVFARYGAAEATALIIVAHIVMTVAHHLPTFIRIYGDVDLFRRFKWSFVLGPVIPLAFSIGVLTYLNVHDYPVEKFLYLYILLALWDPWHFLRQHYGFMRIYDRPNEAPRAIASKMDLWLCALWFVHIMLSSGAWLPGLIQDMYVNAHIEAALSVSASAINSLAILSGAAACMMTIAYGVYIAWCWRRGYFVSLAKLALLVTTFGVMYLTYTPNAWIQALAPGWSFKVGFAAVGIVHMTQYLAIVWRYNRSLAANPERSRSGLFRLWHGAAPKTRAGHAIAWSFAGLYVAVCLAYGDIVTTQHEGRWVMSALLAIGFTSTLMHYYFDGFIWKVRHRQNSEALIMAPAGQTNDQAKEPMSSWWNAAVRMTAARMFVRQLVYFGVPMTLLTVGAMAAWRAQDGGYVEHMYRAQALAQQGEQSAAADEARTAYAAMNKQLPFAAKMAELEPTAAREAEWAFLIYNQSLYRHIVMPQLAGQAMSATMMASHRQSIREAINVLSSAIERGTSLAHTGREGLASEDARRVVESWERNIR